MPSTSNPVLTVMRLRPLCLATLVLLAACQEPGQRGTAPAAVTTPHKYREAPARYIAVWRTAPPATDARGIVYEIDQDDRVMHIHAGGASIEYVEGCL